MVGGVAAAAAAFHILRSVARRSCSRLAADRGQRRRQSSRSVSGRSRSRAAHAQPLAHRPQQRPLGAVALLLLVRPSTAAAALHRPARPRALAQQQSAAGAQRGCRRVRRLAAERHAE